MKKRLILCFLVTAVLASGVLVPSRSSVVIASAETSARGMCTIEMTTGRVLYEKNAEQQLPLASLTKIITAITVIENCDDLDEIITVHPRAIGVEGTSIYLQKGENMSVRELLLGLMLRSGNDCAAALAFHVCPPKDGAKASELFDDFGQKMNETARKAGVADSNFKNPHGLDQEGHYTTAKDLALISAYAMRNPVFAEIAKTKSAKISGIEYQRVIQNKNRLLNSLDGCVGVKTGFTKKAGRCYVGAREKNGMTVICVVLDCGPMFEEAEALMKQADREFTMRKILSVDKIIRDEKHAGIPCEDFCYPLRDGETVDVSLDEDNVCVRFNNELIYCGEYSNIKCED